MKQAIVLAALGLAAASGVRAEVPTTLAVQGRLEQSGAPASGPLDLTLRLYRDSLGAEPVATEVVSVTFDDGGRFAAAMGVGAALDPDLFDRDLYLGVTPQGESELRPLLRTWMAPEALRSRRARARVAPWEIMVPRGTSDRASGDALKDLLARLGSSAGGDVLLLLGAGVYDLGDEGVHLPNSCTLQGVGPATVLRGAPPGGAVVTPRVGCVLRQLRIEHAGAGVADTGVDTDGQSLTLDEVEVSVTSSGAGAAGIRGSGGGTLVLERSEVEATSSGGGATALELDGLTELTARASSMRALGTTTTQGLLLTGTDFLVQDSQIDAESSAAAVGLDVRLPGRVCRLFGSELRVDGGAGSTGVRLEGDSLRVEQTSVQHEGPGPHLALEVANSGTIDAANSRFAFLNGQDLAATTGTGLIRVGSSVVENSGGVGTTSGSVTCVYIAHPGALSQPANGSCP